ncbi:MAG TPA: UDP-glucose 4-epimerase GalE [Bacteroidales bacterium]|nr:UDP-glucose 4-epimerase GalE [Bacteroidales bacterium]
MKVLVTGGLGYIGSHTVVKLVEAGHEPVILDDLSNSTIQTLYNLEKITGKKLQFIQADMKRDLIPLHDIEAVIHFAAYKSVGESVKEPTKYYVNNILSLIRLIKAMEKNNVKKLIFSSSCTVYGQPDKYPVTEKTPLKEPESPYGKTKRLCEDVITDVSNRTDLNAVLLRYFNPIGNHESGLIYDNPKGKPENLLPYIVKVINKELPHLNVFGGDYNTHDGTAIRDYINVEDLAEAHIKALDIKDKFEIFNLGSGDGYSVLDIIKTYKELGINVPYQIVDRRPGDIEAIYSDNSKAEKVLKFKTTKTLKDSIKSTLNIKS